MVVEELPNMYDMRRWRISGERDLLLLKCLCYNFSYPELLLFNIDSSFQSNRPRLSSYDISTALSVNSTVD